MHQSASQKAALSPSPLTRCDSFPQRHLGSGDATIAEMLATLGLEKLDDLIARTVPAAILSSAPLNLPAALGESEALEELRAIASKNRVFKSYLGQGYHDCVVPPVIQRNILENPGWYTAYTPYQAEISQGRLEALLNFQTMVADLTGLPHRQRLAARRGHRRRRGDAHGARVEKGQRREVRLRLASAATRRRSPSCRRAPNRSAIKVDRRRRAHVRFRRNIAARCSCSIPTRSAAFTTTPRSLKRRTPPARSASSPRTCSRSRCCARPGNSARTSSSAARSASACRWASADRTPATSRRRTNSSA